MGAAVTREIVRNLRMHEARISLTRHLEHSEKPCIRVGREKVRDN